MSKTVKETFKSSREEVSLLPDVKLYYKASIHSSRPIWATGRPSQKEPLSSPPKASIKWGAGRWTDKPRKFIYKGQRTDPRRDTVLSTVKLTSENHWTNTDFLINGVTMNG